MGEGIQTIGKSVRRTDRSALHDTDSGMNRQEAFRISQLESKIRNRKTEKGYVVGENGEVLAESIKSSRSAAKFYTRDLEAARGGIMTHNHPNAEMGGSLAAQIGLPFSNADLDNAVKYNLKEIRAVTPNYTYSIRRPKDGWGNQADIDRELRNWERQVDSGYYEYMRRATRNGLPENQAYDRANVGVQWSQWRKTAKALGWNITRKKNG